MPFSIKTKTEMFSRCARICCLCWKKCGANFEAAHIVAEASGGSNDADNGIPICFDCHQEIGAYDDKHPRGNKFRAEELRKRRDHVYRLVESGAFLAQVIAQQARSKKSTARNPNLIEPPKSPKLSAEARRFLEVLRSSDGRLESSARKLSLLNEQDQALILDQLVSEARKGPEGISVAARVVQSPTFAQDQAIILVEQILRAVTLYGGVEAKASLLREVSEQLLAAVFEGLRLAFFADIIEIVKQDQFHEVNEIVPAIVGHANAIPSELYGPYVLALLQQSRSRSFDGAPAAKRALKTLPEDIARAGISVVADWEFLRWNALHQGVKEFAAQYKHLATVDERPILDDFIALSYFKFFEKHGRTE